MCTCIAEIPDKIVQTLEGEYKGKRISGIKIADTVTLIQDGKLQSDRAALFVEIEREGAKRPLKERLVASYCPFCGEHYEQPKS